MLPSLALSNGVTLIRVLLLNVTLYLSVELISYNKEIRYTVHHQIEAGTIDSCYPIRIGDSSLCLFNQRD